MHSLLIAAQTVAALGDFSAQHFSSLTDDALLDAHRQIALLAREVDAVAARASAEVARRSSRELGHSGLAARKGFRSPVDLIARVSNLSRGEAVKLVAAGNSPSVAVVGLDAVDAVNRGLGKPDAAVSAEALTSARVDLFTHDLPPDELFRLARSARDELDSAAIDRREKQQRDLRYWRHGRRADGMVTGSYLLDPESGALLSSAFETLLSPRRGGPRFVDSEATDAAKRVLGDSRTDQQFAADALVALVETGVRADAGTLFPSRRPAVRVIVRERDLAERTGHGVLEDSGYPISIAAVERHVCTSGLLGIRFDDDGRVLDVGRTQRLHTERQRIAIAARDGGCMFTGCAAPVSRTEVHHVQQWQRDGGGTSVENGILLCRFHHVLLHNNDWRISCDHDGYLLHPPGSESPTRLVSKNPLLRRTG